MRRIQLATLLLTAVPLILSGCRQTTGAANTGPLTPIGPLSPIGQGQAPILGPFGGATRVTPPGTGSYLAPNNYMGGVAPIGQANLGVSPAGGFASQPSGGVIGSGVQAAGWTETNSSFPSADLNEIGTPTFGINPSPASDPRSGGMQIIDLTGAPAPPGYRPAYQGAAVQSFPNQIPAGLQSNPNLQPGIQQGWQQQGQQQPVPQQTFQNPNGWQNPNGLQPITTPNPGEIANRLTPISSGFPPASDYPANLSRVESVPRTATLPAQGPSTEPVSSGTQNETQNLPWRRPGTRY